jgi:hypothetical protein
MVALHREHACQKSAQTKKASQAGERPERANRRAKRAQPEVRSPDAAGTALFLQACVSGENQLEE